MEASAEKTWNNCLIFIKDNIQQQAFKTWFEPIIPLKISENSLSIQVPSKFFYEWLEEHYVKILKVALTRELGDEARLIYTIKMENTFGNKAPFTESIPSSNQSSVNAQKVDAPLQTYSSELKNPFVIPGIRNLQIESQLNPNYNFENFLEGDSNRLARSAGLAVSNKPGGTSFNPLMIFGGVGLGKTHLAHAIGVQIKNKYPDKTVLYISAEKFTAALSLDDIVKLQQGKTGALILWAITAGAHMAGEDVRPLENYAKAVGLAFQIADDLLDATGNQIKAGKKLMKDASANKATFVSLLGVDGAQKKARDLIDEAYESVAIYGQRSQVLKQAAEFVISRDY